MNGCSTRRNVCDETASEIHSLVDAGIKMSTIMCNNKIVGIEYFANFFLIYIIMLDTK